MSEIEDRALGWDDVIENDSADFVLLPEGEYSFEVKGFERGYFKGSTKIGACNQAVVNLEVFNADISGEIKHNLFLNTKTEGMLCEFFRAIGLRKHGDKGVMPWNKIAGCKGRCKVIQKELTSDKGEKFFVNNVKKFLDPETEDDAPGF
jgi:hypothetical protein